MNVIDIDLAIEYTKEAYRQCQTKEQDGLSAAIMALASEIRIDHLQLLKEKMSFEGKEVVHAHWIFTNVEQYCSYCGKAVDPDDNADAFRFACCPWCGAIMDEKTEE